MIWNNLRNNRLAVLYKWIGNSHTVLYDMCGPERTKTMVAGRLDWSGTTKEYLCWARWLFRDHLNLQQLIASWIVRNDNKLHPHRVFRYVIDDIQWLSNNPSVHVWNAIKVLSSDWHTDVRNYNKLRSSWSTIWCPEWHLTLASVKGEETFRERIPRTHWATDGIECRPKWCKAKDLYNSLNCGRTAKDLCRSVDYGQTPIDPRNA